MRRSVVLAVLAGFALAGCSRVGYIERQTKVLLSEVGEPDGKNFPRSEGEATNMYDWTSGFFPGSLWYINELSNGGWEERAREWTSALDSLKHYRGTHDLGFMIYCSHGHAADGRYDGVIVDAAEALSTRWSPRTGVIKSWNGFRSWDGEVRSEYPVIIDNMMNLELLFAASKVTGDPKYRDIAVSHADKTMENHFREDGSTYHVVCYDPQTGDVTGRKTWQGYSDNSTWARGQAWAIYGYTMCARESGATRYLDMAVKAADWYLAHLPQDMVPYWDFNVGQEGYIPAKRSYASEYDGRGLRDVSAAAITCSALFELSKLSGRRDFRVAAEQMLRTLWKEYRAEEGTNGCCSIASEVCPRSRRSTSRWCMRITIFLRHC